MQLLYIPLSLILHFQTHINELLLVMQFLFAVNSSIICMVSQIADHKKDAAESERRFLYTTLFKFNNP